MKLVYNLTTICLLLVGLLVNPISGVAATSTETEKQEFTKSIKKDFSITSDGSVKLSNKYGKINIKTWEKKRVKVDVLITVNATSESSAQEVFNRISIDFENGNDFISAVTEIASNNNSWWSNWGSSSKSDFNIDYEVNMPQSVFLDLKNKYGDAYVTELTGSANVDIKYGDFNLDGIGKNLNINLSYGEGTVVKASNIDVNVSYSKLKIQSCKDIKSESKYSKIAVNKAHEIQINSAYDTYNIGRVRNYQSEGKYDNVIIASADNIIAYSKYSDYTVGKIIESADFELTYGGAKIEYLAKDFSEVRIVGRYADFKINVEEGASYQLDASADYAGIRYPKAMNVSHENERGTSHQVEGYVKTKEAQSVIKVRLDYGGFKIE